MAGEPIEEMVLAANKALDARDMELVSTGLVTNDPVRTDETRAIGELTCDDIDLPSRG